MRLLLLSLLAIAACGKSGGGGAAPAPAPVDHLSFSATCPTDAYYPSTSYGDIDITITNDGNVNNWTQIVVTMDGNPYTSPVVPSLSPGDVFHALSSLRNAVGDNGTHTFVVTSPQYHWSQTFLVVTHFPSPG